MIITIENYRGFDIEFNTSSEKFLCIATEETTKESKSFSAVRKFVDEYKKTNQDFKPFYVEKIPERSYGRYKKVKVIGIRKDNSFVAEIENGEKFQIGDYDTKDYMLFNESNKPKLQLLDELEAEFEAYRKKYVANKKEVIDTMDIADLKEYKKTLIG